jgi:YD repeat-containing protein
MRQPVFVVVFLLSACSGTSVSSGNCRTYAVSVTQSNVSGLGFECSETRRDGGQARYSCALDPSPAFAVSSRDYQSVEDFVAERQLGIQRYTIQDEGEGFEGVTEVSRRTVATPVYDGGTIVQVDFVHTEHDSTSNPQDQISSFSTVFSAWDSLRRPTRGIGDGGDMTIEYDDLGRTIVETDTPRDGGPPVVITSVFDSDGNLIRRNDLDRTITKTEQVCVP